jgi:hypothetical protein
MDTFNAKSLYWITGVSLFFSVGFYVYRFHSFSLSSDAEKWGQLGDYIGGVINPLAALMNVYVAIQIAREVSKFGEKQTKLQLETQKELVKNELLYQILSRFQNDILTAHSGISYAVEENRAADTKPNVQKALVVMDGFMKYYQSLFLIPPGMGLKIVVDYQTWLGRLNLGHHNQELNKADDAKIKLSIDMLISLMYGSIIEEAKIPEPKPVPKEVMDYWDKRLADQNPPAPQAAQQNPNF